MCMHVCACSVMSYSLRASGLQPTRFLWPWSFPGKNTAVGCHFLLQRIFLTQGSNPHCLLWQVDCLPLSHQGTLIIFFNAHTKQLRRSTSSWQRHAVGKVSKDEYKFAKLRKRPLWGTAPEETECRCFFKLQDLTSELLELYMRPDAAHLSHGQLKKSASCSL